MIGEAPIVEQAALPYFVCHCLEIPGKTDSLDVFHVLADKAHDLINEYG